MAVGYIYVLSNPSHAGLLKIGFTCGNVEARARELSSSSGVVSAFIIEAFRLSNDVEEVERLVHKGLAEFRVRDEREFFQTTVSRAIGVINSHVREPALQYAREPAAPASDWTVECRRCGNRYIRTERNRYCPKCNF